MNNLPLPIPIIPNNFTMMDDINQLKERVKIIEEKLKVLEQSEETDYLKNDDNYYMI